MALLQAINYDPATLVTKATSTALVMTPFDTTNLRITFEVPATGRVFVRIKCALGGSNTGPTVFLGVMSGTTVVARTIANVPGYMGGSSSYFGLESVFTVVGLTPGATLTWDAAYGVDYPVSSTNLRYGGPDDAVANNSAGAFHFEVWEA